MVSDANLRMRKLLEQTEGLVHVPNTPYVFRVGAAGVSSGGTCQFFQPQHEGCVKPCTQHLLTKKKMEATCSNLDILNSSPSPSGCEIKSKPTKILLQQAQPVGTTTSKTRVEGKTSEKGQTPQQHLYLMKTQACGLQQAHSVILHHDAG